MEKMNVLSQLSGFNRPTRPPPTYVRVVCTRRLAPQGLVEQHRVWSERGHFPFIAATYGR
jgi:hypothetical protein